MERVMVDNWLLEEAVINLRDEPEKPGKSLSDLLMAILLWDEVCFPENQNNYWRSIRGNLADYLTPITDEEWNNSLPYMKRFSTYHYRCDSEREHYLFATERNVGLQEFDLECIGQRAQRYLRLSGENDCSYFPYYKRQDYLEKTLTPTKWKLSDAMVRISNQKMLDSKVKEYVEETFKSLLDMPSIEFSMPVLTRFILENTPDGMSPVDYAFHMRMEGPVIQYRKYLQELSGSVEKQDWKEFRKLGNYSIDAIKSVIEMDKGQVRSIKASLLPTPSIMLDSSFMTISTDSKNNLTIKADLPHKKYHLTFLRDLTRFGINEIPL